MKKILNNKLKLVIGIGIPLLFVLPVYSGGLQILKDNQVESMPLDNPGNNPFAIEWSNKHESGYNMQLTSGTSWDLIVDVAGYKKIYIYFKVHDLSGPGDFLFSWVSKFSSEDYLVYQNVDGGNITGYTTVNLEYDIESPKIILSFFNYEERVAELSYYYYLTA